MTASVRKIVATAQNFMAEVVEASNAVPVLVDFWAPWCGPCKAVSPIVEELGREYAGRIRVVKVNTDAEGGWAGRLGIRGIPTLIFFKGGREVDRVVGAAPKGALKSHFDKVLGMS